VRAVVTIRPPGARVAGGRRPGARLAFWDRRAGALASPGRRAGNPLSASRRAKRLPGGPWATPSGPAGHPPPRLVAERPVGKLRRRRGHRGAVPHAHFSPQDKRRRTARAPPMRPADISSQLAAHPWSPEPLTQPKDAMPW